MIQVVKHLLCKYEALNSNPNLTKKKKKLRVTRHHGTHLLFQLVRRLLEFKVSLGNSQTLSQKQKLK
jgi:hypothetical protein